MAEVTGIDKLLSAIPRKRFSKPREFGTSQFGYSAYGEEDIYLIFTGFGDSTFGPDHFGNIQLLSGIYRTDNVTGKTLVYREPFYITKNPRSAPQQAHRHKYGEAVGAWRGLTDEQKEVYNKKSIGKGCSGWNIFYKEYLLSH